MWKGVSDCTLTCMREGGGGWLKPMLLFSWTGLAKYSWVLENVGWNSGGCSTPAGDTPGVNFGVTTSFAFLDAFTS